MNELPYPPGLFQERLMESIFRSLDGAAFWGLVLVTLALYVATIIGLQRLATGGRRRLTVVCTFIAGLFYVLVFFLPPGNRAKGLVTIGGQEYRLAANVLYVHPELPEVGAEEEPIPAEPAEPAPTQTLAGTLSRELPDDVEAGPTDSLPVAGRRFADGDWELTVTTPDGEVALQPAGEGTYTGTILGETVTLAPSFQPAWNFVKGYEQPLGNFQIVLFGFGIGLGIISLCMLHGRNIARRRPGWHNSVAFFLGFLAMTVFGLWNVSLEVQAAEEQAAAVEAGLTPPTVDETTPVQWPSAVYDILFYGLYVPLEATTFALLGFYIVSAAYRAFRIRSTEAALITIVAFVMMLGQVPLGQAVTSGIAEGGEWAWVRLENITNWLLSQPAAAAFRGILFGASIGGFALSLRVWLSLERGSYFGKEF